MIKAIFSDVDGVFFVQNPYWSERYAKDFNVPIELMRDFFLNDLMDMCLTGKADFKDSIKPFLTSWKWKGTADELLNYWLNELYIPHTKYIKSLKNSKLKGIKLYLATQNDKYRTNKFINVVKQYTNIDGVVATYDIGYKKSKPEYYIESLLRVGLKSDEVVFIDNNEKAISAAKSVGISTIFFTDEEQAINELKAI